MQFSKRFIITQVLFALTAAILLVIYFRLPKHPPIPVYGQVADFKLTDQNMKERTLADFKGKVWVADFIFTTCSGICPTMSKNMMALHNSFADIPDVRMVSISVNPENDTPAAMNIYAKKYKAQGDKWIFLTGKREIIQDLAVNSFQMGDIKDIVFHSAYFALVDRKGQIRGYYDGMDEARLKQLNADIPVIVREK